MPYLIANEAGSSIVGIDGFLSELGQHRDRVTSFPIAILGSLSLAASALAGEDATPGSGLKSIHTARNIAANPVSWLLAFIRQGQAKAVASLSTNHDLIADCTALALRRNDWQLRF